MVKHVKFNDKITMPVILPSGSVRLLRSDNIKQLRKVHKSLSQFTLNANGSRDEYYKIILPPISADILPKKAIKQDTM
jgi:hypothetical protein